MDNSLIKFLKLFRDIPAADSALLEGILEHRSYKEGSTLLKEASVPKELFFITLGVLKIQTINEKGNEVTHFFLKENQFCTILNSFNNQIAAPESIKAACDAEVIVLPRDPLLKVFARLPYLKELITQIMQQALLDKIATRNAYLGQDSASSYKIFMMRQPEIAFRVQLSDIASYLGITPQSLSRIRKNMR
jgi:CRP-like cAMP-binding protein